MKSFSPLVPTVIIVLSVGLASVSGYIHGRRSVLHDWPRSATISVDCSAEAAKLVEPHMKKIRDLSASAQANNEESQKNLKTIRELKKYYEDRTSRRQFPTKSSGL